MRLIVLVSVLTPLLLLAGVAAAQERRAPSTRGARGTHRAAAVAPPAVEDPPVPVLPSGGTPWVPRVLIAAGAILLAALVIGPIYRANMPDELPPTHSHDEPPGASHRHGPGGEYESAS